MKIAGHHALLAPNGCAKRANNGKKVKIKTIGLKDYSGPVKEITVDGKPVEGWRLDHEAFKKGSTIVFKY